MKYLSGMLDYNPNVDWADRQQFDANGMPIPISAREVALEAIPESMAVPKMMTPPMTDEQVHEAAEVAEAWKKELQRLMSASSSSAKFQKNMKELEFKDEEKMQELAVERAVVSQGMLQVKQETQRDTEGRGLKGYKPPAENTKPGWTMAEGTNWWSVNTDDPYWDTEEGYQEALNLYGESPAWSSRPVEQENQFVDLQPTKRISL
jgi:D-ribose pyranose/furanose isomerase RbsD